MKFSNVALRVGLLAAIALLPLGAHADSMAKLDPRARVALHELRGGVEPMTLQEMGGSVDAMGNLDVFITGNVSRSALEGAGAIVRSELPGGIFTAFIPDTAVEAVAALPGVSRIDGAVKYEENLNASVPTTKVDLQRGAGPAFAGYNGAGVLIGDIDSGISYAHGDFDNAAGNTRILRIWDQTQTVSIVPPAGYTYGTEYLPAAIDANTAQGKDTNGHGTHVMGIAAGDGSLTGGTVAAYTYAGMAPMADIIEIKSTYTDTQIADGAAYFFGVASALGKNAVLNISLGGQYGPHDGTAALSVALDGLVGPGRAICVSAGNDGGTTTPLSHRHARVYASGAPASAVLTLSGTAVSRIVGVNGYYDAADAMTVTVSHPSYGSFGPYPLGSVNAAYPGVIFGTGTTKGYLYVENGYAASPTGDPQVYCEIKAGTTTGSTFNGDWTFTFTPTAPSGPEGGRVDLWRFYSSTTAIVANFSGAAISDMCLLGGDIATSNNVITCGAWTTKTSWTNCANLGISFSATVPVTAVNGIASFSSNGPTRDNRVKPDIAAPGHGIASSTTQDVSLGTCTTTSTYYSYLNDGMKHWINSGTSMAAPHVTGAVALLFQKYGALDRAQVMAHLTSAALVDANTGTVPNNTWGVGKLRIDVTDPTATVAAPNGGELLITGYPTDIIWTAADPVWTGVSSVDIQLSRDNGASWEAVATGIANTGLYTWTPTGPSTYIALMKVTAHDGVNNTGSDVSNAVFAIDNEVVANELPSFLANNTDDGVSLSWRFADAGRYVQSWVERASNAEFSRLDAPVNVTTDGFSVVDKTAEAGVTYQYRIAATETSGAEVRFAPVSISANNGITAFAVGRAFPNPTATGSTIAFAVPRASQVSVKVFDVAGRLVSTLADQQYAAGRHEVTWNGRTNQGEAAANGVYFVHFVTPETQLVQRVMVVK